MTTADQLTVLVVDDDFRVASVHQAFVEQVDGFRVVGQAHSGAEALELSDALHPDLVLMDIYLPDVDGLRTLQEMMRRPSPPAAMVISAATDVANVRSALRLGVTHYLVKPFSLAELVERLTAFRDAATRIDDLPIQATQSDINRVFDSLRTAKEPPALPELSRLAPTLQLVYDALAGSEDGLSAAQIAADLGMSRTTAQRSLTQLEQGGALVLEMRYGRTGRPEHRYKVRHRR